MGEETGAAPKGEQPKAPQRRVPKPPAGSKLNPEVQKLQEQIKKLERENQEKEMKLQTLDNRDQEEAPAVSDELSLVIANLQQEIENLKKRGSGQTVVVDPNAKKGPQRRPPTPDDLVEDEKARTYVARSVIKVIPGYMDQNGIEVISPHKVIRFDYAASDIKKDGKEDNIINFCTYTTRLKTEIEFLESHPEYGITFSQNMNEVAGHDAKEYEFRAKASQEVMSISPESLPAHCEQWDIKGWHGKSNRELRQIIVNKMVEAYVKEAKRQQEDLQKRILAVRHQSNEE